MMITVTYHSQRMQSGKGLTCREVSVVGKASGKCTCRLILFPALASALADAHNMQLMDDTKAINPSISFNAMQGCHVVLLS